MTAGCGPVDGFETVPGAIPPRTQGEWPADPAFAVALARSRPERGGSGPIWPGAALKKVAPAYLSRPTAAPIRSRTAE